MLRIFGPRKDNIIGRQRKLHNHEIHKLYSLPNTVKVNISLEGIHHKIYLNKNQGKRPLGRLRCRWDNIKLDHREIGREFVKSIQLSHERIEQRGFVTAVMNNWFHKHANFLINSLYVKRYSGTENYTESSSGNRSRNLSNAIRLHSHRGKMNINRHSLLRNQQA